MKTSRKLRFTVVVLAMAVVPLLGTGAALASHPGASNLSATIRFTTWDNKTMFPYLGAIFNHMHKTYPNIKVKIEAYPDSSVKLITQIATGTGPDVIQIGQQDVPFFVLKGALVDLDSYMRRDHLSKDMWYPAVYNMGVVDGKLYALTKDYATLAVFYNKDLFKAAHVPFPKAGWTWNDLLQDARKLTVVKGGRIVQWGVSLPGDWLDPVEPLIYEFGGRPISPDGKKIEGYLNSPQTIKAMQFYMDMFNKYHVAPTPAEQKAFSNLDMFSSGKVAMNYTGPWQITTWLQNKNFHFGVAPAPSMNGKAYSNICWAGFSMSARTKQQEASWQVTKALGGPDGSSVFARWALPGVKAVAVAQHIDKDPYRGVFVEEVHHAIPSKPGDTLSPDGNAALDQPFNNAFDHLAAHPGASVKAALDEAAKTGQKELDNFLSGSGP